jgi:hypothetical protein
MRSFLNFSLLMLGLLISTMAFSQKGNFRYLTKSSNDGSTFYALNGMTGQLYYMHDFGTEAGTWKKYGSAMRASTINNLGFAQVSFKNGTAFYALETNIGQMHFMLDFGPTPGKWTKYGGSIRMAGDNTLQFSAEPSGEGTKFTALDGTTGQVYYMFDMGTEDGVWKKYGGVLPK